MKKSIWKRIVSLALVILMIVTNVDVTAYATGANDQNTNLAAYTNTVQTDSSTGADSGTDQTNDQKNSNATTDSGSNQSDTDTSESNSDNTKDSGTSSTSRDTANENNAANANTPTEAEENNSNSLLQSGSNNEGLTAINDSIDTFNVKATIDFKETIDGITFFI
jgi:cobalamin biosynthesis protein CobT